MKRFLFVALSVAGLVTLAVGWLAPSLISWYFTPPVEIGVTCKPAVVWAIDVYRKTLLAGGAGGFLVGLAVAGVNAQLLKTPKA
ncbi:MAG: hypothetical protein M0D55_01715 [Elusimicrobiota bacterium]|nr:MAG: hypothetical protein M0D55_01715 [Elusimicrobiota bacterium]